MERSRYSAVVRPWQAGAAREWNAVSPPLSPFQSSEWLDAWYAAFSGDGVDPVFVEMRHKADGARALALPLILRRENGLRIISFADLEVTDYNAPLLGEHPPRTPLECREAWDAVDAVLPPADVCLLQKMPEIIGDQPNPLVQALGGVPSPLFGNLVETGDDLDSWRASLDGHARGEFARLWRVFSKHPDPRFIRARTYEEALPLFDWLETWQARRSAELGRGASEYRLDQPRYARFYRDLMARHAGSGEVILTALASGERLVAVSFAIASGTYFAHVRIAFDPEFAKSGPARLLLERTVTALHAEGFRQFDFTIGDYQHKRKFKVKRLPLRNVTLARSLYGIPSTALSHAKAFVRSRPSLERLARQVLPARRRAGL